ncbi:Hypothetical predicted protein [Marmota monax]|uniref:NXPE C-terminal domain-containing protein n=1 Tax=Marmota monax TaxID=9995 RepID=A0A5E4BKK6_MARMO|nr:Hypothetical predicted protein [Marmota monax]
MVVCLRNLKVTDKLLPQGVAPILIRPATTENISRVLSPQTKCRPGLLAPKPSGFYHQDVWHSLSCSGQSFPTVDSILGCLAGHIVHMMGDSTLRQWWEYLRDTVPCEHPELPLRLPWRDPGWEGPGASPCCWMTPWQPRPVRVGTRVALETTRGIVLHWRSHSWPLRSQRTPVASLHSVAKELEGLAWGPPHQTTGRDSDSCNGPAGAGTLLRIPSCLPLGTWSLWAAWQGRQTGPCAPNAHQWPLCTLWPRSWRAWLGGPHTRRLAGIRTAVMALLEQEPSTLVVIKLANTGYKSVYGSDWFTLQVNRLLRAAFAGLRVAFVDAWEMTSSLALPDNIHPGKLIVSNGVNLLLSFICPPESF